MRRPEPDTQNRIPRTGSPGQGHGTGVPVIRRGKSGPGKSGAGNQGREIRRGKPGVADQALRLSSSAGLSCPAKKSAQLVISGCLRSRARR